MENKQTYRYEGLNISYQKLGKGPPLILLHGWGVSGDVMMPLARQLSDIRSCYIIDLPGFGHSDVPSEPWKVDDYAHMVRAFIRNHFAEKVDLLVHSFGARIALKLCAHPAANDIINKVLITGGAGMKPKRSTKYYFKKYTAKILKTPFYLLPSAPREKMLSKLRQTSVWKALGSSDYQKLEGVMRETFVRTVTEYLEPSLSRIPHEVLLLWGKNDEATPLYQAERMERGIKESALVTLEHAGHYAFLDQPQQFVRIAKAFFEGGENS